MGGVLSGAHFLALFLQVACIADWASVSTVRQVGILRLYIAAGSPANGLFAVCYCSCWSVCVDATAADAAACMRGSAPCLCQLCLESLMDRAASSLYARNFSVMCICSSGPARGLVMGAVAGSRQLTALECLVLA